MDAEKTLYEILQVSEGASSEVITAAYLSLKKKYHPDNNPAFKNEALCIIKQIDYAYSILSDPAKKSSYDKSLYKNTYGILSKHVAHKTNSADKAFSIIKNRRVFILGLIGLILVLIASIYLKFSVDVSFSRPASKTEAAMPVETLEKVDPPRHGAVIEGDNYSHFGANEYDNQTSFLIKPPYQPEYDYLLKLTDVSDKNRIYLIYVKGGESNITLYIQAGTYEVKYACGSTWYGRRYLFGDNTQYYKYGDALSFYRKVDGQEFSFPEILNGNLKVESLSKEDFYTP